MDLDHWVQKAKGEISEKNFKEALSYLYLAKCNSMEDEPYIDNLINLCKGEVSRPKNRTTFVSGNSRNNHHEDYLSTADNSTVGRKYSHENSKTQNFNEIPNFRKFEKNENLQKNSFSRFSNNFERRNLAGGDQEAAGAYRRRSERVKKETALEAEGLNILQENDYFKILGLNSRIVTDTEVKKAFKKLTRKYHPDISSIPRCNDIYLKVKDAFLALKTPEGRMNYEKFGTRGRFRIEKFSNFDKKIAIFENNARIAKKFIFFLAIFCPFLVLLFRYITSSLYSSSQGYSLTMHYRYNLRYKTPANSFTIFVERNFLEFDKETRWDILQRGEIDKIGALRKECDGDKRKILALEKKIEDNNDGHFKAKEDIERIRGKSVCQKLEGYEGNFIKIFEKGQDFFDAKPRFQLFGLSF